VPIGSAIAECPRAVRVPSRQNLPLEWPMVDRGLESRITNRCVHVVNRQCAADRIQWGDVATGAAVLAPAIGLSVSWRAHSFDKMELTRGNMFAVHGMHSAARTFFPSRVGLRGCQMCSAGLNCCKIAVRLRSADYRHRDPR